MTVKNLALPLIVKQWKRHRNALIQLVNILPEEEAQFRLWKNGMTMIELIHHLAWTPDVILSVIEGREKEVPPVPTTLAEAYDLLKQLTEKHERIIASFTEEKLEKEVTIERLKITESGAEILHRIVEHEAHHKGQLIVYARMLGLNPPFYIDLQVQN